MTKDELGLRKLVELLRKWAGVLTIPSGEFVNEDLRRAADAITALIAERDALAKRLDHYIGMHGANIRTGRRLVLRERARAEAAEAQLKAAREVLEAFVTNFAGMEDGDGNEAPELALARSTLNLTVNHDG